MNTNVQRGFQICINVPLRNGKVSADVNAEPPDHHQYLHYLSAHPYCTKKSVVFEQTVQISSLCRSEKDFENHKQEMKSWFWKGEYPQNLVSSEMKKVKFSSLRLKSNDKNHNIKGIPYVVTYHPLLKSLRAITDKYLLHIGNLLYIQIFCIFCMWIKN